MACNLMQDTADCPRLIATPTLCRRVRWQDALRIDGGLIARPGQAALSAAVNAAPVAGDPLLALHHTGFAVTAWTGLGIAEGDHGWCLRPNLLTIFRPHELCDRQMAITVHAERVAVEVGVASIGL